MPNIIEQQDLLKGLPDARLAMLLQNPVADIPPFLVAAEAQRRQSIRQQFATTAPNESVVESLTKQIAKVPQNLNAPGQAPAMVPPTPPMQGVMALQQQQAMQNAAQQAMQPQMMRAGGMVRRYQVGGVIAPPARVMPYVQAASGFGPSVSEFSEFGPMPETPSIGDIIRMETETDPLRRRRLEEKEAAESEEGFLKGVALPDVPVNFPPPPPKPRPRPEEIARPEPGETEDQFRARLEGLYASQEPSDWEKAQKWFAMSEQFLDPSKTTMQSIAGAGRAFSESAARQSQEQRLADVAREKAMLEYDMTLAQQRSAAQAAEREAERQRTTFSAEKQADILIKRQESLARLITSKKEAVLKLSSDPLAVQLDPTIPSRIAALESEIAADEERLRQVEGSLSSLGEMAYGPIPFDTYSLRTGFTP